MLEELKEELWRQFGASLDMFENAIRQCPNSLWDDPKRNFCYNAYHSLFYIDYYSTIEPENFSQSEPFNKDKDSVGDTVTTPVYTKEELLEYAQYCREKSRLLIAGLTPEKANMRWINKWKNYSMIEIIIYNMRHLQHHVGQLNLLLGEINHDLPIWVSQTKEVLNLKHN